MQNSKDSQNNLSMRLFCLTLGAVLLIAWAVATWWVAPSSAWAQSYEVSQVEVEATIEENGNFTVAESRQFAGMGKNGSASWSLSYLPEDASTVVRHVSLVKEDGAEIDVRSSVSASSAKKLSASGEPSYVLSTSKRNIRVYFGDATGDVRVKLTYLVTDAVSLYKDVAELNFNYVAPAWDVDSCNVEAHVNLPVPDDAQAVAGDTVYAWGHGPADGTVLIGSTGTITAQTDKVAAGQFAQLRIEFPVEWLTKLSESDLKRQDDSYHLTYAINQEKGWVDRTHYRHLIDLALLAIAAVSALVALLAGYLVYRKCRLPLNPTSQEMRAGQKARNALHVMALVVILVSMGYSLATSLLPPLFMGLAVSVVLVLLAHVVREHSR